MSLQRQSIPDVPEETELVAKIAFPKGNFCLTLRDRIGTLYDDESFRDLFSRRGQPAESPWRLALVCVLQFVENLTDRQAAEAVRARIDWKYLLSLPLTDPGFDYSVLSEFRTRLVQGEPEQRLLDSLLEQARHLDLLPTRGQQRTDSTHVLAAIRGLNRLETVIETLRHTLNILAEVAPAWLLTRVPADWELRYRSRADDYRLPKSEAARLAYAQQVGQDGGQLLQWLTEETDATWLNTLPAVQTLQAVWQQNYQLEQGQWVWRTKPPPPKNYINSPYDVQARYSRKRSLTWIGYKVHFTETCDPRLPSLITHVETTAATRSDDAMTDPIHQALAEKGLLPQQHWVDTGYVNANTLLHSQLQTVDLLGPTRHDYRWQAREGKGYAAQDFTVHWDQHQVTCPQGKTSLSWTSAKNRGGHEVIKVKFSVSDCPICPAHDQCTRASRRTLSIYPQAQQQALHTARTREQQENFPRLYTRRAGVEGTHSQAVRVAGLRRSRYIGEAKTHLQHVLTAVALNCVRLVAWWEGTPRAKTRVSAFALLFRIA